MDMPRYAAAARISVNALTVHAYEHSYMVDASLYVTGGGAKSSLKHGGTGTRLTVLSWNSLDHGGI
jgi:hypothetical protein